MTPWLITQIDASTETLNQTCSSPASDQLMMLILSILLYACFLAAPAIANVEKTIFTAPESVTFGDARPNLLDLHLVSLSPKKLAVRTALPVVFPTEEYPRGLSSWYLLDGLNPGQRYEQPTDFLLESFKVTDVFDSQALLKDLSIYAEERQSLLLGEDLSFSKPTVVKQSALFLRIQSVASFYTTNKELMQYPPPVDVDIILDPYLLNIFPQSLLPTAAYIILLAVASWFLSGFAWAKLQLFQPPRFFRGLPTELILEIMSYLSPDALLSFGFANYHLLVRHSMAPLLSSCTMTRLVHQAAVPRTRTTGQLSVPTEVNLQILRHLGPVDSLNYAMANYLILAQQGIAPSLSTETLRRLNRAVQRGPESEANT
ncbi:hypothetical protein D6D01_03723 [Aureobasidium pullulans]|uniref:F-box domain-containing protein n=1 Tax=Aureobasidium pullulans TaxID=5580 RepID=A0A4S9LHG2_AURPU|nr:hypothetical protein D6D01_03723 [Aureobasidium pullulans]